MDGLPDIDSEDDDEYQTDTADSTSEANDVSDVGGMPIAHLGCKYLRWDANLFLCF